MVPLPTFILHNFHRDPKAQHFDHYANNNSYTGACGNSIPTWAACLGYSKVQVQDCPTNLQSYIAEAGTHYLL